MTGALDFDVLVSFVWKQIGANFHGENNLGQMEIKVEIVEFFRRKSK